METRDRAADLKHRLKNFERDPFFRVLKLTWPIILVSVIVPNKSEPWWLKYAFAAFFIPVLWAILRHRFFISAVGLLVCMCGMGLSLWYDLSGTKRPAWDQYTGFLLLTGIATCCLDMLISWIRYKALEKEKNDRELPLVN